MQPHTVLIFVTPAGTIFFRRSHGPLKELYKAMYCRVFNMWDY